MSRYRLLLISAVGLVAVLLGTLMFGGLNQNLVYYLTPEEAITQRAEFPDGARLQIGGLVVPGSVVPTPDGVRFVVTGVTGPAGSVPAATVGVDHHGAPAQLFAAGIGVVIEGTWNGARFMSDSMKVKHDENYRPPAPPEAAAPPTAPAAGAPAPRAARSTT